MKVNKVIKTVQEVELDIIGATLLSAEEAEQLPMRLKGYDHWWWTLSPAYDSNHIFCIESDGYIYKWGHPVDFFEFNLGMIRPALQISNFESSNLKIGDTFKFGTREFEIISDSLAFCTTDIGLCRFDDYSNNYETSEIKMHVDDWFNNVITNKG